MVYRLAAWAAGDSGYFLRRDGATLHFQTYTLMEARHRLERGTLGSRWGVCRHLLGGLLNS